MIRSTGVRLALAILLSALPTFAQAQQLIITSGDPTFQLGWVEWRLDATGGTSLGYTWSLVDGTLPTGVVIRSDWQATFGAGASGLVGIATTPGTYNFTLQVTDSGGNSATRAFTATVLPLVVASHWELPYATRNVAYDQTILAAGGSGTLTFSLQPGSLPPPGLSLASSGRITGTPTTAGTYDFGISITDGSSTISHGPRIYVSPLNISTAENLPNATQGVPYSQTIAVSGGTPPYTFSIGCCAPWELSLNAGTGVLSGTFTGPGYHSLDIEVRDSTGAWARRVFRLGVIGTPPVLPGISTWTLEDMAVGTQTWATVGISGGTPPYTWSVISGSLPPGMVITSPTIAPPAGGWRGGLVVGGAPTAVGNYAFTLRATDSSVPARVTSRNVSLRVVPISFHGLPNALFQSPYSRQIDILGGAPPYSVSVGQGSVPAGLSVSGTGLVTGTPQETGPRWFQVRASGAAGEVVHGMGFTVDGTSPTPVEISEDRRLGDIMLNAPWSYQLNVSGGTAPYTWKVESGSTLPAGLALSPGGVLSGIPTVAGVRTFFVRATDAAGNFGVKMFSLNVTPIWIQTSWKLPYGNVGSAYGQTLSAGGGTGTITWSVSPDSTLPTGMSVSPAGLLSWPTTIGGYHWFELVATDSAGATRRAGFQVEIYPAGEKPPLYFSLGDQSTSIGYNDWSLGASGGTETGYSASLQSGTLPPGMTIENNPPAWLDLTGSPRLSGVATTPSTYSFTLRLTDSGGNTLTRAITVSILGMVMTSDTELADASVGVAYSKTITTAGATGTVTFAVQFGQVLPPGLSLNSSTGILSGTPTVAGEYWFLVNITDSTGSITQNLHLYISPMRITSAASLPNSAQGSAYSQTITVAGGTPPYNYTLHCCAPGWLSLNATTGVLSGTPDSPGVWGFTVRVADSTGAVLRKHYQLAATGVPAALLGITSPYFDDVTLGEFVAWDIGIYGGTAPYTWSVPSGGLPPGMSVQNTPDPRPFWNVQGAWLVGRPAAMGVYTFTVQVTDSSSPPVGTNHTYTVRVSPLAINGVPGATFGTAYSQRVRVLGGVKPYAISKTEGNLPSGLTLDSGGLISGTPTETGDLWSRLLVTDANGNSSAFNRGYNVNVNTSPASSVYVDGPDLGSPAVNQYYDRYLNACCGTFNWTLEGASTLPAGLSISPAPPSSVRLSGIPTTAGAYSFSLRATDATNPANFGVRTFRMTVTPLQLAVSTQLPWGNAGSSYSTPLSVSGNTGAVTWSLAPGYTLPAGMSLSPDGVLSGTPTVPGQYWPSFQASDAGTGASVIWGFSIAVYPPGAFPPVSINNPPNLGTWSIGKLQLELSAQGGDGNYSWNVVGNGLPTGLTLRTDRASWFSPQASAGLIGLLTSPGTYTFTLKVTSASSSFTRTFTAKVVNLLINDPNWILPEAFVEQPYPPYTFTRSSGGGSVTWSLQPGSTLPPGMSLSSAGVLSGTPTTVGNYNFNVQVSDGTDTIASGFSFSVLGMRITTPRLLPNGTQGAVYSLAFATTGAVGTVTWNADWVPPGLTLLPNGTLTGTPSQPGTWSFWVTATDSGSQFHQVWCTLNIVGVPPILPTLNGGDTNDQALGVPMTVGFSVYGGTAPYTWTASGLPQGISLVSGAAVPTWIDRAGAALVGTPTSLGKYTVTVTATDSSVPPVTTRQTYAFNVVALVNDSEVFPSYPTRGQPYQATLRTIGGTLPYTWSLKAPWNILPAGLTLNSGTGVVSGTPVENGTQCPRVLVTDAAARTFVTTYCFSIGGGTTTININDGTDLGWTELNGGYSRTFSASGAPSYSWSVEAGSTLPAGLSFSTDGVLSGTPTAAGTFTFLLRATDSANAANYGVRQFRLIVTRLAASYPDFGWTNVGTSFTRTPTVSGNVGAVTWSLYPGHLLPPGLTLNSTTGTISGTPTSAGAYNFNVLVSDPAGATYVWPGYGISIYPVGVKPPLSFEIGPDLGVLRLGPFGYPLWASGGWEPYTYSYAPGAPTIPGVRVQSGPPFEAWWSPSPTGALESVLTTPGTYSTTIRVTDSHGQFLDRPITFRVSPVVPMTNDWLPRATVGSAYSFTFEGGGGTPPYVWTLEQGQSLPPGVTSLTQEGLLSGIPTTPGTYNFQLRVTDAASNYLRWNFNLEVMPFAITTPSILPQGIANSPYSIQLAANASGVTWSMADRGLPGGLSLDEATGVISGTPTGTFYNYFTVRATSGTKSSLKNFSLTIVNPTAQPLSISSGSALSDVVVGWNVWFDLFAYGGTPPYSWSVEPGSTLPPGMELVNSGETVCNSCGAGFGYITGSPNMVGDYTFTLTLTDSAAPKHSVARAFTLHVASVSNQYLNLPIPGTSLASGTPYSQVMLGTGGTGTYTWAAEGPLPAGLSLSPSGTISGTTTDTGELYVPVRITDSAGATLLHVVRFFIDSGSEATLTVNVGPDLGTVSQGSSYSRDLWAYGSPLEAPNYQFSAQTSLPTVCSILAGNTIMSGTTAPARLSCNLASPGTFNFTIRVQDANGNLGLRTLTLRVTPNAFVGGTSLNDGATGISYSQRLPTWGTGGTWSVAPGSSSLPPGLTLSSGGVLSGSPTTTGTYTFVLRFTDASGLILNRTYTMNVAGLAITDPALIPSQAIMGEPFTYTFTAQGGGASKTWSLASGTTVPPGMNLSPEGTLSGTTVSEGNYLFYVRVTDGTTSFTRLFTLAVRQKYPWLTSSANPTILPDMFLGQSTTISLSNNGGVPPYTWSVAPGSSLPPGMGLLRGDDYPPGYPTYTFLGGIPTAAGQHTFTLRVTDAVGVSTQRTYSLNVATLSLPSGNFPTATYNTPYTQALTALGGTATRTFAVTGGFLPAGLTLSPAGVVSGTPTNTGNWTVTVKVSDSGGQSYSRNYSLVVNASTPQTMNISTSPSLPDISAGSGYTLTLSASGGTSPYTWNLHSGILTPGLSLVQGGAVGLNPNNWYLYGRAGAPGVATFTLRVQDSAGNEGYKTFTQRISALQVLTPSTLTASTGDAVAFQLAAVGGTPPFSFALAPGSVMPLGLTLNSNGSITGSTPESGSYYFPFIVTDAAGNSLTTGRTIAVYQAGAPVPLQGGSSDGINLGGTTNEASVSSPFLLGIDAYPNRGNAPYTWSIVTGSLPPGMSLVSGSTSVGGYIIGAPSSVGSYSYGAKITDSDGQFLNIQVATEVSPLSLTPDPLPPATVGTAYAITFVPTGGTAPYSLKLPPNSTLPPGLTLSGMALSGTPNLPGAYSLSLTLRDSAGKDLARSYRIYVDSAVTPAKALSTSPGNVQVTVYTGTVPAPVPITVDSGTAAVSFTASVAGITGASLNPGSGTTPQSVNLLLPSGLATGTYYGVIEVKSAQAPNSPLGVRVVVNVVPAPFCSYTVGPATVSMAATGGPGSLTVGAADYCSWAATIPSAVDKLWIKLTSAASGSGNGAVSYSLSPNAGTNQRTGTINVSGQTHTITQFGSSCAFAISPGSATVPAAGGGSNIAVNASQSTCAWTVASNDSWIHVTSGSGGTGSGSLTISVDENIATSTRIGTVTVAGATFTVNQSAAGCTASLSAGGADVPASGGAGSVKVTTNCPYSTVDGPSWITVTSGGSGPASGTLDYSVAPNSSTQTRTGSILVGGQPFQIVQAGLACSFTITPDNTLFGASGGTGSIAVEPNGSNCGWTTSSSSGSPPWLTITSGASGTGVGQVNFGVSANGTAEARSGPIVVAGQTITISQGGVSCEYSLRSVEGSVPAAGGTGAVGVVSPPGCAWTAVSDAPSWIQISSGTTGSGSGDVIYAVSPNTQAGGRAGTLTIQGKTYTVTQPGVPCSYALATTSTNVGPDGLPPGTPGSFSFTANQAGCAPMAVSLVNWIGVSTSFSGTAGSVTFTVGKNPLTNARSGIIQLGDQAFTVKQSAAACSFSLNAYGAVLASAGGTGEVLASASALGCTPAVGASPELIPLLGPLSQDQASRIWTQPYGVPPFGSYTPWTRLLQIDISGEIFTVKQTSW